MNPTAQSPNRQIQPTLVPRAADLNVNAQRVSVILKMVMITNIKHFLDENGDVPDLPMEALELVKFLSAIIESASSHYEVPLSFSVTKCRCIVDGKSCAGEIEVWVYAEDNRIGWECLECGDEGVISEWEGTLWDKRNYTCH